MISLASLPIILSTTLTLLSSILITPVQSAAVIPSTGSSNQNTDTSFATAAQPRLAGRPGWNPLWGLGPVVPPPGVLDKLAVNNNDSDGGDTTDPDVTPPSDSTDANSNSNSDSNSMHGANNANAPATSAVGKNGIDANDLI